MSKYRVVIVGAGASGIAAANRLMKSGINDILVLEAENRIGGRVYTTEFGENEVDMGAQWVHGEINNVVYEMAKPHDLLGSSSSHYPETSFVTSAGELVSSIITQKLMTLLAQINESAMKDLDGFDGSLGDYFTKEFNDKLDLEENKGTVDRKLASSLLEWYHKFENSIDASESWFETSGKGHLEYWECEGNPLLFWKNGGYSNVFNLLAGKYANPQHELPFRSKIQLKKEVVSVQWDDLNDDERRDKVSITCADGSEYIADHVIITVSLGVLKERINMFHPELPMNKSNAIKGLGIGTVDKIYLRYFHRWWPKDSAGFSLVWNDEGVIAFKKELVNNHMEDQDWLFDVFGFYSVDNHPLILCGWVVGSSAKKMEQISNELVASGCNLLLNFFLSRLYSVPETAEVKRSDWFTNPHFRGSYSLRTMETEKMGTSAEHLSHPVFNKKGKMVLQFAGEATHPHYFSTVHGAVESGWREADRSVKYLRHQNDDASYCLRNEEEDSHHCDVVIIGAGIAGIAAAQMLMDGGMKNIAVLEAQSYAGGRIRSLPFKDSFLELGAQWIHGERNNIFKLAQQYNLTSNVSSEEGEGVYLREDGSIVPSEIVEETQDTVDTILEECESFARTKKCTQNPPSSVGHYLKQKFREYLDSCLNSGESKETLAIKEELYDWHLRFQVIDNACMDLENLSAKYWGNYVICSGSVHVNFCKGYTSLINELLTEIDSPKTLYLNCPVKEVIWNEIVQASVDDAANGIGYSADTIPVKIICENGKKFYAKHAIITCSLGYLKDNHRCMFTPPLPRKMQDAIEDMGFATINKIFLDYGKPWWEPHVKGFQLLWTKEDEDSPSRSRENWMRDLSGFDVLPYQTGVLIGWVGSFGAQIVEEISEEEIGRQCTDTLRQFTRREDIPSPKRVIRSKWFSNPYVRGSYSHTTSKCDESGSAPSILSEPIYSQVILKDKNNVTKHPTLLFAGEATHKCFFSTTHGAYESGKKQAKVILKNYNAAAAGVM